MNCNRVQPRLAEYVCPADPSLRSGLVVRSVADDAAIEPAGIETDPAQRVDSASVARSMSAQRATKRTVSTPFYRMAVGLAACLALTVGLFAMRSLDGGGGGRCSGDCVAAPVSNAIGTVTALLDADGRQDDEEETHN